MADLYASGASSQEVIGGIGTTNVDANQALAVHNNGCDDSENHGVSNGSSRGDGGVHGDEDDHDGVGSRIVGKVFATTDDAYQWYSDYAFSNGFAVRIGRSMMSSRTKEIVRRRYVCNKEGFKSLRDKRQKGKEVRRQRDTRTGCNARIDIKYTDSGEWIVCKFLDNHNHPVLSSSKVITQDLGDTFHHTTICKSLVDGHNDSGFTPPIITKPINTFSGSDEGEIPLRQHIKNQTGKQNSNVDRECFDIIKHLQERALSDDSHFFAIDLDNDGCLRHVFWADGRSRTSYSQFGDVVIFDLSYVTYKYKMPFAPFVGINHHHRQPILFAGAFLEDESDATFEWLFQQFLRCMYNMPPVAILTDQDPAILNAIKKVFPNAKHHLFFGNVQKHINEYLQSFRSHYADFDQSLDEWMMSDSTKQFELAWETLKAKYKVENSDWLCSMYNMREHWVDAYLKDTFLAGMTMSRRNEYSESFFDGYLNSRTTLDGFLTQYDKAVKARRDAEHDEDVRTLDLKVMLFSEHPIEGQASRCYTRAMFDIFQKEWKVSGDYFCEKLSKQGSLVKYNVGKDSCDNSKWRVVEYDRSGYSRITCSCSKFETEGMLCKHQLCIMRKKSLRAIPDRYILHRWTIDARYRVRSVGSKFKGSEMSDLAMWAVRGKFSKVMEGAHSSPSILGKIDEFLDKMVQELADNGIREEHDTEASDSEVGSTSVASDVHSSDQTIINDPGTTTKYKVRSISSDKSHNLAVFLKNESNP